jgi:hypothetical protein
MVSKKLITIVVVMFMLNVAYGEDAETEFKVEDVTDEL